MGRRRAECLGGGGSRLGTPHQPTDGRHPADSWPAQTTRDRLIVHIQGDGEWQAARKWVSTIRSASEAGGGGKGGFGRQGVLGQATGRWGGHPKSERWGRGGEGGTAAEPLRPPPGRRRGPDRRRATRRRATRHWATRRPPPPPIRRLPLQVAPLVAERGSRPFPVAPAWPAATPGRAGSGDGGFPAGAGGAHAPPRPSSP